MEIIELYRNYIDEFADDIEKIKSNVCDIVNTYNNTSSKYKTGDFKILIEKIDSDMVQLSLDCMEKGYKNESYIDKIQDDEKRAIVIISMLDFLKKLYDREKISDEVFYDTISDVMFRIEDYEKRFGKYGLEDYEGKWLLRIFYLKIFKLGCLQFEISKIDLRELIKKGNVPQKYEDVFSNDLIEVHIMENEDISPYSCRKSFELADEFFDANLHYYACYSWILAKNLDKILKENSNILSFRKNFEFIIYEDDCKMAKERAFKKFDPNRMTSLQKGLLENPECMGMGLGIMKRN